MATIGADSSPWPLLRQAEVLTASRPTPISGGSMRRPLAVSALVLSLGVALLGGTAQAGDRSGPARTLPSRSTPIEALRTAREVLGSDPARTPEANRSATLALRDLFAAR